MPSIEPIQNDDIPEIIHHCVTTFHGKGMPDDAIATLVFHGTDWSLSKKLVLDGKIIGFYLFHEGSIIEHVYDHCNVVEDLSKYKNKRGIEGVALVILPEYRGRGYGEMLKDLPKHMGYDYVFGDQLKSLNNLQQWLKQRRLVADCGGVWVTLQDLK